MTEEEWDYWYEGKPARTRSRIPTAISWRRPGAVRDGGSFYERMGNIACWNTVMDEDDYMVQKWNEFIAI